MERIVLLVALALIFGGGVVAINASFANSGEATLVENEQWNPDVGNVTTLNYSNLDTAIYEPSVSVHNDSGRLMMAGEDYVWFRSNGTVKAVADGDLAGETNATITYRFNQPDSSSRAVASLLGRGMNVASFFLIVVGIGIVLGAVRFFGGR